LALRHSRAAVLLGALLLSGCVAFHKLDMEQVHRHSAHREHRNPVIVLHGFLGSKLEEARSGRSVWGRVRNLLTLNRRDGLDLPVEGAAFADNRDGLAPYEICDSVGGIDYYGPILTALQEIGGYERGDIEHPHPGETLYVFAYDWRRDNVETAARLAEAIDRIRAAHGRPELKVDLVAHSMGGLVARYYIKYGRRDVIGSDPLPEPTFEGAPHVDKVVLIGTPNEGSMAAFKILNRGIGRPLRPEILFTMPALFQLLPGKEARPFVDEEGNTLPLSLHDPDNWVKYGWSAFRPESLSALRRKLPRGAASEVAFQRLRGQLRTYLAQALERADRFRRALAQGGAGESAVRFYAFGSDCIPTPARTVLHRQGEIWRLAFSPEDMPSAGGHAELPRELFYRPGDGSVTLASLMAQDPTSETLIERSVSFTSTVFLCETHGFLSKNLIFQNNLFHVLSDVCEPQQDSAHPVTPGPVAVRPLPSPPGASRATAAAH
jgi:pimeloyl-ACP methyl ester carboxylesterase